MSVPVLQNISGFLVAADEIKHWGDAEKVVAAFLRYHATENREVLIERIARAPEAAAEIPGFHWERYRSEAEAIVTALVGLPRE